MTSKSPLELWQEKLVRLQQARALATDPAIQMQLDYGIAECVEKIQELGGDIPNNKPTSNSNTPESVLNSQRELRDLFLACPSFNDRQKRNRIIDDLRPQIAGNISRGDDAITEFLSIFNTVRNYKGGLKELLDAIEFYEGDSIPFQALKQGIKRILPGEID